MNSLEIVMYCNVLHNFHVLYLALNDKEGGKREIFCLLFYLIVFHLRKGGLYLRWMQHVVFSSVCTSPDFRSGGFLVAVFCCHKTDLSTVEPNNSGRGIWGSF